MLLRKGVPLAVKFLLLIVATLAVASGGVSAMGPSVEPKLSPQSQACRLVFEGADANSPTRREPICIRNISADSCEALAASQSGVAGAVSRAISARYRSQVATNCAKDDCILDVVYPSDAAHCQGISLTPSRLKVDKTTTSGPVSASF